MGRDPKTSVVIPVYNTRDYLPATLDSVLAQTQEDIEVILVDDGSTDGSLEIEYAYQARDSRVRVVEQPNLRQGTARNTGLRMARGEFVYFMDSDDLIVPTLFEECYAACQEDGLDFVTFDSAGFLDDPDIERPELFSEIRDRREIARQDICDGPTFWNGLFQQGGVPFVCWLEYFRRDFLQKNDLFFTERIYFEDNDWIVRVFLAAQRMRYLPRKLHRYRERPGSNVHSGFKTVLAESCFDIHHLLFDLYRQQEGDVRRQMVRDVHDVVGYRFLQFAELEPDADFRKRTAAFMQDLVDRISACAGPRCASDIEWHLKALLPLTQGVCAWEGFAMPDDLTSQFLLRALFGNAWDGDVPARVAVYGTGKVCRLLLDAFWGDLNPTALFETNCPRGTVAYGIPVHPIDDARTVLPDIVLVASTRYADDMVARARAVLGPETPVLPVLRAALKLEGCRRPLVQGGCDGC